jgi:putative heme-binding domain-containing protein
VADRSAAPIARLNALQALAYRKDPALVPVLHGLLKDKQLRAAALRSLATYSDEATPGLVLNQYAVLNAEEKAAAISTLASRSPYALALLDAIEKGQVPRKDISLFTVRQMQALKDRTVNESVTRVWGTVRPATADKRKLMAKYKAELTPPSLKRADRSNGRLIFQQTCASCHVLFGEGGKVGPELTGSQRMNLDYLLENILDPSAIVHKDYQVTTLMLKDGRVITGIVKAEVDQVLMMQTEKELLRVLVADVEERQQSKQSIMPEGLLTKLTDKEVRDLIGYLVSPEQAPLPKRAAHP